MEPCLWGLAVLCGTGLAARVGVSGPAAGSDGLGVGAAADHHLQERRVRAGRQLPENQVEGDQPHGERGHGALGVLLDPPSQQRGHRGGQQVTGWSLLRGNPGGAETPCAVGYLLFRGLLCWGQENIPAWRLVSMNCKRQGDGMGGAAPCGKELGWRNRGERRKESLVGVGLQTLSQQPLW